MVALRASSLLCTGVEEAMPAMAAARPVPVFFSVLEAEMKSKLRFLRGVVCLKVFQSQESC